MFWIKELGSYLYTRFPVSQFAPLAILVALAGLAASPPPSSMHGILAIILTLSLILQFRLWDDIADRHIDSVTYPERVLCRTSNTKPFIIVAVCLFILNGIALALQDYGNKITGYILLSSFLLAWYRLRTGDKATTLPNTLLTLVKYPAIAWLISTSSQYTDPVIFVSCLISIYLIFLLFDTFEDSRLRRLPGSLFVQTISLFFLVCTWIIMALWNRPDPSLVAIVAWIVIVLLTVALSLAIYKYIDHESVGQYAKGFFIIALLAYITIAIEKGT